MTRGRPVVIMSALLLLLTYLLMESRSPGQIFRTRAQESLQALQLTTATLNRAVLMIRAGLQLHYDALPRLGGELGRELGSLQRESAALAATGDRAVASEVQRLADALSAKSQLVEHFTSDYAVLRNSTTYFGHLVQRLTGLESGVRAPRVIDAAHVLMQFVQAPEAMTPNAAQAALATIDAARLDPDAVGPLAAHARIIVEVLPRVDGLLRAILESPAGARGEAVQQALLQSANAAEARAQRFRLLLYVSALALLGYLLFLFARLRTNAAELRRKELQLIQANKMTALGMLVSSVAHEVNNPNQVVLTNASVLTSALDDVLATLETCEDGGGKPTFAGMPLAETRDTLPRLAVDIQNSARRIEAIVDDLKYFARPGGRARECFDLNDVVRRALRLLTYPIQKRTDSLQVTLDERLPAVSGNAQHLEQVTVNLVVNALEALPSRSKGVTVTTTQDGAAGRVLLEIADEGIGMSEAQLSRLGEAFFTTKEVTGGTGLGVAIASSLVRLYDGQLTFASEPGCGTRARVSLPVAPDALAAAAGSGRTVIAAGGAA
jgi:signal transduction histidine kinase